MMKTTLVNYALRTNGAQEIKRMAMDGADPRWIAAHYRRFADYLEQQIGKELRACTNAGFLPADVHIQFLMEQDDHRRDLIANLREGADWLDRSFGEANPHLKGEKYEVWNRLDFK